MISAQEYFLRLEEFPHRGLFEPNARVWEGLARLDSYLQSVLERSDAPDAEKGDLAGLRPEAGLVASEGLFLARRTVVLREVGLLIEAGVRIEPWVVVKGPTVLCAGAELRHGAYLRGRCLIGPDAVVGHATEVKNSAFLNHAEAGHFAYVGDSILGAGANLGAGTKLANLQLRTEEEKRTRKVRSIVIRAEGESYDTGLRKFGAIVGDDVEIGCNTVTAPGTLLGPGCWVAPITTVPKGMYPPGHFLKMQGDCMVPVPRKR